MAGGVGGGMPAMVHTVHNVAEHEVSDPLGRMLHRAAFRRGVVPVAVAGEVAGAFRKVYGFERGRRYRTAWIPRGSAAPARGNSGGVPTGLLPMTS